MEPREPAEVGARRALATAELLAVRQPGSQAKTQDTKAFAAVADYRDFLQGL